MNDTKYAVLVHATRKCVSRIMLLYAFSVASTAEHTCPQYQVRTDTRDQSVL
jgi:hypothetical protein